MKIYIVTSGEYSDYGIESVHLSKEEAEEAIKVHKVMRYWYDRFQVQEWETGFDSSDLENQAAKKGMFFFYVYTKDNGVIDSFRCNNRDDFCKTNNVDKKENGYYESVVMARDEDHAEKIFADLLIMYKYQEGLK